MLQPSVPALADVKDDPRVRDCLLSFILHDGRICSLSSFVDVARWCCVEADAFTLALIFMSLDDESAPIN